MGFYNRLLQRDPALLERLNGRGLGAALVAVVGLGAALFAVVGAQPQALKGRYGEVIVFFPENPMLGPGRDAWINYLEHVHNGITYRSFLPTDPYFGDFAHFGFASDSSVLELSKSNES